MASIDDLPDEIILHICSFLPSRVVITSLSAVSRRFLELLGQEWHWRRRYTSALAAAPGAVLLEGVRAWQRGCIQAEFTVAISSKTAKTRQFKGQE